MDSPTTHQELFEAYLEARSSLIGEFTADYTTDYDALERWAKTYADQHALTVSVLARPLAAKINPR